MIHDVCTEQVPSDVLIDLGLEKSEETTEDAAENWGTRVAAAMRHPLPLQDELRAWQCLLWVLEAELRGRPTVAADAQLLSSASVPQAAGWGGDRAFHERAMPAAERSLIQFRLDKTSILADAARKLRECIAASWIADEIVLLPEGSSDDGPQLDSGLKELTVGLSDEFVKQAAHMPPAVRTVDAAAARTRTSSTSHFLRLHWLCGCAGSNAAARCRCRRTTQPRVGFAIVAAAGVAAVRASIPCCFLRLAAGAAVQCSARAARVASISVCNAARGCRRSRAERHEATRR